MILASFAGGSALARARSDKNLPQVMLLVFWILCPLLSTTIISIFFPMLIVVLGSSYTKAGQFLTMSRIMTLTKGLLEPRNHLQQRSQRHTDGHPAAYYGHHLFNHGWQRSGVAQGYKNNQETSRQENVQHRKGESEKGYLAYFGLER